MTEIDIIRHLAEYLDIRFYPFQLPRSFIYEWESDYWAMTKDGVTREYEIKISRSDFRKDAKKDKHKDSTKGANFFYYVCPDDVIKPEEVDKKYGLIYVDKSGFTRVVKRGLKLHKNLFTDWKPLCIKIYWKWLKLWREKYMKGDISTQDYLDQIKNIK